MPTYKVSRTFGWQGPISKKVRAVMRMFGLTVERLTASKLCHECTVRINPGEIVYITGPSGAGKSVLLRELEKCVETSEKISLTQIEPPDEKILIDCMEGDLLTGLKLLSAAGLGDVFCILNKVASLSVGQRYRFRLAMALAAGKEFIFADEFCSGLDRITASVISYNLRKFANRTGVTLVLAASEQDILPDLAPDVLVVKELSGGTEVIYKQKTI